MFAGGHFARRNVFPIPYCTEGWIFSVPGRYPLQSTSVDRPHPKLPPFSSSLHTTYLFLGGGSPPSSSMGPDRHPFSSFPVDEIKQV